MKKLAISKFDIGYIIAFVVVTLLGGGAWYYLSGALQDAQTAAAAAKSDYDKYQMDTKYKVAVSPSNVKTLQANIDLLKGQVDPLIPAKLQPKENKLHSTDKEDPVAWKHDLDDEVHRLTEAAKEHGVTIPANFYFGFSRYLSQSPNDEQTAVLSKQLIGMEQLADILIKAPVKNLIAIRRTYEEDPHTSGSGGGFAPNGPEGDHLQGFSTANPSGDYVAYPFEVEFVTNAENLRPILDDLVQSPYVFVVRTLTIQNTDLNSPKISDLANMAGGGPTGGDPNASTTPAATLGPQYLFGNSNITVKARIDMIEWKGVQP